MSIKIENVEVVGWEHAIRGMRNPKNSWEKGDSLFCLSQDGCDNCPFGDKPQCPGMLYSVDGNSILGIIGPNDQKLMMSLAKGGPVHAKYRRMITVYLDITAPLYWWKEFDTYKVGTVANSCSTMHKIHAKEFEFSDFSMEHLLCDTSGPQLDCDWCNMHSTVNATDLMCLTIATLNHYRELYLLTNDKIHWWQMIQLLPSSYNQKRTVMLNYEVLRNMYHSRKNHKLDCWRDFCSWVETLPYSELITTKVTNKEED